MSSDSLLEKPLCDICRPRKVFRKRDMPFGMYYLLSASQSTFGLPHQLPLWELPNTTEGKSFPLERASRSQ